MGFWRNLIGQGEKWQLLKASPSQLASATGGSGTGINMGGSFSMGGSNSSSRGCEEAESRGKYVRIGDAILLQTYKSDHLLSLHEALYGPEAKLVFRDRAGLGAEVWQVEQFNSIGLPAWYSNRPYLRYEKRPSVHILNLFLWCRWFVDLMVVNLRVPQLMHCVLCILLRLFITCRVFIRSGQYLVMPTAMKNPAMDIQVATALYLF